MQIRMDGKVALVTGGSRGIGRAIAAAFAGAGARVMITSRSAESCAKTAKELGPAVDFEAGHVGREAEVDRVIDATLSRLGRIDVLVNNAATNPYAGPMIDVDRPRWDKTFETNLTAPMFWTQKVWRRWMRDHGGSIVNVSSVGGLATTRLLGVYDMTKAAMIHMTKQLAAELAPSVRVNCLAPGIVRTEFARALWEGEAGEAAVKAYPLGRLGEPEDVAGAALFLAADTGRWITGQTWVLDGGGLIAFTDIA
ncbi:MAG: SDR family oxidoreductase [Myxococcota bacterium]